MHVKKIDLYNLRNFAELSLELNPGINLIEGPNATGKTTLLEALSLLAFNRSFRTHKDKELLRFQTKELSVRCQLSLSPQEHKDFKVVWQQQGERLNKKAWINEQPLKGLATFYSQFPLTIFAPDDLALIQGSPHLRRRFLDQLLCKIYPNYVLSLKRYQHALQQRNTLLKQNPQWKQILPWTQLLLEEACYISQKRQTLVQELASPLAQFHSDLANERTEEISIQYSRSLSLDKEDACQILHARFSQEKERGQTLYGPHREDFLLQLNKKSVKQFASQGQKRSAILAFTLAQNQIQLQHLERHPIILFDDCLSELDPSRRSSLLKLLENSPQILITSATPLDLKQPYHRYQSKASPQEIFPLS